MPKPKSKSKSRAGRIGSHGSRAVTDLRLADPAYVAALRAEAGQMVDEIRQSRLATGSVSAGSSITADMALIEDALQGLVDVETMDKIGDLVVRAPVAQVIGMLALAKLIKEGRA